MMMIGGDLLLLNWALVGLCSPLLLLFVVIVVQANCGDVDDDDNDGGGGRLMIMLCCFICLLYGVLLVLFFLWLGMIGIGARLCLWLCEWGHCSSRAYSTGSLADLLLFLRACCLSVDEIRSRRRPADCRVGQLVGCDFSVCL